MPHVISAMGGLRRKNFWAAVEVDGHFSKGRHVALSTPFKRPNVATLEREHWLPVEWRNAESSKVYGSARYRRKAESRRARNWSGPTCYFNTTGQEFQEGYQKWNTFTGDTKTKRRSGWGRQRFFILEQTRRMQRRKYDPVILLGRLALLKKIRYAASAPLLQVYTMVMSRCFLLTIILTMRREIVIKYAIV